MIENESTFNFKINNRGPAISGWLAFWFAAAMSAIWFCGVWQIAKWIGGLF